MPARDPRTTAANLLLGFAGGATVLAAAVSTTTGHQGPFATAGLAGLSAGAGYAARLLAVEVVKDERADVEMQLADAYTDLTCAQRAAEAERGTTPPVWPPGGATRCLRGEPTDPRTVSI